MCSRPRLRGCIAFPSTWMRQPTSVRGVWRANGENSRTDVRLGGSAMKGFNHPKATGGRALAEYGYKWARISAMLDVRRVAVQALTAMYGKAAARAAINEARRVSRKTR
jgi:hypothetical protein